MYLSTVRTLPGLTDAQRADLAAPVVYSWALQGLNHDRFAQAGDDTQKPILRWPNQTVNISTVNAPAEIPQHSIYNLAVGRANPRGQ
jgi:hypothetical protein